MQYTEDGYSNVKRLYKKNKYLIILIVFVCCVFVYTHLNTFLGNDDLPYSYFYRGSERITNII